MQALPLVRTQRTHSRSTVLYFLVMRVLPPTSLRAGSPRMVAARAKRVWHEGQAYSVVGMLPAVSLEVDDDANETNRASQSSSTMRST